MLGTMVLGLGTLVIAGTPPGLAGCMPAYYDGKLFLINFTELPSGGETAVHARNGQINIIYQSDQAEALGFDFVSVLDAIQGDGFNLLWEEWQIIFVDGQPRPFFSDDEILAAMNNGEIMLMDTDEIFTCAVVGPK
jgi:hypothetical protein